MKPNESHYFREGNHDAKNFYKNLQNHKNDFKSHADLNFDNFIVCT